MTVTDISSLDDLGAPPSVALISTPKHGGCWALEFWEFTKAAYCTTFTYFYTEKRSFVQVSVYNHTRNKLTYNT
jgi:hypothetical protein